MEDLSRIYRNRFETTGVEKRNDVWRVLSRYFFSLYISEEDSVLDLACGYGEFINNIKAKEKFAVDLNPDAERYIDPDVRFLLSSAEEISYIDDNKLDVVFTSNFLEHLNSKSECSRVIIEVHRILKPGGRFIILGPNIRYAFREYWDFYDHHLPLSHVSLSEGLRSHGFKIDRLVDRFLPYTMSGALPTHELIVRAYLAFPLAWKFFGKQFLVVARKQDR